jgi:hypothetical protein
MARKQSAKLAADILDELLPPATPTHGELHLNATVLEVADAADLLELAADPALRQSLLCRLGPTVALVDPGQAVRLVEVLRKRGHTPKIVQGS